MRLSREEEQILAEARIGLLALSGRSFPLVTAGAYYQAGDSIWLTTSRFAQKVRLIERNRQGSFLVSTQDASLLLQGRLETFDLMSLGGQLRAAVNGPRFYGGLAGYTLKNLSFISGYLLELDRVPRQWWPQNRLVLRMQVQRARRLPSPPFDDAAEPASLPDIARDVSRRLGRVQPAHVCWRARGGLVLQPGYWARLDGALAVGFARAAELQPAGREVPAAVVVEKHHRFRPTQMVGACLRGRLVADRAAEEAVALRYGLDDVDLGACFRLEGERVSWWKGFEAHSQVVS